MTDAQTLFSNTRKHKLPQEDGTVKYAIAIPTRGKHIPSGPVFLKDFFKHTKLPLKHFYLFKKLLLTWLQTDIMKPDNPICIVGFEMDMKSDGDDHIYADIRPIGKPIEEVVAEQEGRKLKA